jgi:hypothetical protein
MPLSTKAGCRESVKILQEFTERLRADRESLIESLIDIQNQLDCLDERIDGANVAIGALCGHDL